MIAAENVVQTRVSLLSIGQVLSLLQSEFSDLSPSKLRFLEEQGLIEPQRTPSGYRKFSQEHVERLRLILTLQRDHYLPLKVIAGVLEDIDAGKDPVIPGAGQSQPSSILKPNALLNKEELLRQTGAKPRLLGEAIAAGLLPATDVFPRESLGMLEAIVALAKTGITPRHLRSLRLSAEKDAELLRQAAMNVSRSGGELSVQEETLALAAHFDAIRAGVLRHQLLNSTK